jgi:DNA polymerase
MPNAADLSPSDALAVLEWQFAAGVDVALGEAPVDRFASSRMAPPPAAPAAAFVPAMPLLSLAADAHPDEARALAAAAPDLQALEAALRAYDGCPLKLRAKQLCFADGNPEAEVMIVGEGPGEEEDKQGKPFVGRAGQLLDKMLAAIGLDRSKVYIANTVPWRPPGNREPTPQEMAACAPFIHRQIELVAPKILLTAGAVSTRALIGTSKGITRVRGEWFDLVINGVGMRAMPILHPAYLLRQPLSKRQAWQDMLAVKAALSG